MVSMWYMIRPSGRPAHPVGERHRGDGSLQRSALIKNVESTQVWGLLVERHAPGPEAARRIAFAVVHADVRAVVVNRDRALSGPVLAQEGKAFSRGSHQTAAATRGHGGHHNIEAALASATTVEAETVKLLAVDVQPDETLLARIPNRPFPQSGAAAHCPLDLFSLAAHARGRAGVGL